jgi:VCBS repeat-containing protein
VSGAQFDAVHINSEQPAGPTRGTDHDPMLATFLMNSAAVAQAGTGSGDEDMDITGTLVANDRNGDTLTYTIVTGPANGSVTLGANGAYTYTPDGNFNGSDSFTFRANDGNVNSNVETVSLTINAVNDAPNDINLGANSVSENAANGTVVGTATAADPDAGSSFTYQMVDPAGGRFAINATTGQITVANGSLLDFETATSYTVWIRVTDGSGGTYKEGFVINLTDVFDTGTDITLAANTVLENAPNGTVVGTINVVDPGPGVTLSYLMVDPAGGRFTVDAATGVVTVANGSLLDYESATSHTVWVRVFDSLGNTYKQGFTINVTDVPEGGQSARIFAMEDVAYDFDAFNIGLANVGSDGFASTNASFGRYENLAHIPEHLQWATRTEMAPYQPQILEGMTFIP